MSFPDPCADAVDCGESVDGYNGSANTAYEHNFNMKIASGDARIPDFLTLSRRFAASHGWSSNQRVTKYFINPSNQTEIFPCGVSGTNTPTAGVSENCTVVKHIPYYIDRLSDIYVYKKETQALQFTASSQGKLSQFQCSQTRKTLLHTILLKNSVKTNCTEEFILNNKGVITSLASVAYSYNPFEGAATAAGTYGMGGGILCSPPEPTTADVSLILMFPNPGKKCILMCIPDNKDPLYYGFYDYTAVDNGDFGGGVTEQARLDGGYNYFYPHWLRAMFGGGDGLGNPVIRDAADFIVAKLTAAAQTQGRSQVTVVVDDFTGAYQISAPESYCFPFGSLAYDSQENFVYSMLLQFSDRSDTRGAKVNYASFGDLYEAIYTKNKIPQSGIDVFYPVCPI